MKKNIYSLLHTASILGSYSLAFSIVFFIQNFTIGKIYNINKIIIFDKFYLSECIFIITSILIVKKYIKPYSPYEKYLT